MESALHRYIKNKGKINHRINYQQATQPEKYKYLQKELQKICKQKYQSLEPISKSPINSLPSLSQKKKKKPNSVSKEKQSRLYFLSNTRSPIKLTRANSTKDCYRRMPSALHKPTDKHINEMKTIQFVERLLLMKPSKSISKQTHNQFYKEQNKYRKNLQINRSFVVKQKNFINEREWL